MIDYKNTISGGSSIMQPIRIPENTRNVILVMNLICYIQNVTTMLMKDVCIIIIVRRRIANEELNEVTKK